MFQLEYDVSDAGWAAVDIKHGEHVFRITVSYLHDSLKQLAESALKIQKQEKAIVVFMDEPGEHQLVLQKTTENNIHYELRWYHDWASWEFISTKNYKLIHQGNIELINYVDQVKNALIDIMAKMTPEEYKAKWIEHEFPMKAYQALISF